MAMACKSVKVVPNKTSTTAFRFNEQKSPSSGARQQQPRNGELTPNKNKSNSGHTGVLKKCQRAEPVEELSPNVLCSIKGAQAPHGAVPKVSFLNDTSLVHSGQKIFVHFVVAELRKSILWKIDTGPEI